MNHKVIPFAGSVSNKSVWLFDLDGVIIDSMPLHCLAWIKAFKTVFHIDVPSLEIYKREGEKNIVSIQQILSQYGIKPRQDEIELLIDQKRAYFEREGLPEMYTGMDHFLRQLKCHIRLGLVTGTPEKELLILLPPEIRQLFEVHITSDKVMQGKPHPEPYQKAMEAMECQPDEALVIENAPLGIRSAREAGLTVIGLPTSLPLSELHDCHFHLESHADLYALGREIGDIKSTYLNMTENHA